MKLSSGTAEKSPWKAKKAKAQHSLSRYHSKSSSISSVAECCRLLKNPCVIAQEHRPVLSSRSRHANMSHLFLDGRLTHAHIQLEQLPTDAFGSPEPVVLRH